jgi:hypothetical protein
VGPIGAVSASLAEILRVCPLRAGLAKAPATAEYVLGSPKGWLGTAYHEVLARIGEIDKRHDSVEAAVEELWKDAIEWQQQKMAAHPLNRRYGRPETWPGYFMVLAHLRLRAQQLVAEFVTSPYGSSENSLPAGRDGNREGGAGYERWLSACGGRLVGRPDVILPQVIVDYKTGSIFEFDDVAAMEIVRPSYVRQLRIYGFLVATATALRPRRGVLLPIGGPGVEIDLNADECAKEATEAVRLLDTYNVAVASARSPDELAKPSALACKWCTFKGLCEAFWREGRPDWAEALGGVSLEGTVVGDPRQIFGGALALRLSVERGTAGRGVLEIFPLNLSIHDKINAIRSGDRIRVVNAMMRQDGSVLPVLRTVVSRVQDLPEPQVSAAAVDVAGEGSEDASL